MIVASIIKVTDRTDFYLWLDYLPWKFTDEERYRFAEKAKYSKYALWTRRGGFKFW